MPTIEKRKDSDNFEVLGTGKREVSNTSHNGSNATTASSSMTAFQGVQPQKRIACLGGDHGDVPTLCDYRTTTERLLSERHVTVLSCPGSNSAKGETARSSLYMQLTTLLAADGFIMIAGGSITDLLSLVVIILFNTTTWPHALVRTKRLAIVRPGEAPEIKGWDQEMLAAIQQWGRINTDVLESIAIVATPQEAVQWIVGQ